MTEDKTAAEIDFEFNKLDLSGVHGFMLNRRTVHTTSDIEYKKQILDIMKHIKEFHDGGMKDTKFIKVRFSV